MNRKFTHQCGEKRCRTIYAAYLLIDPDGIEARIHDVHPAVARRKNKERHEGLAEIVEVVLPVEPDVALICEAVGLVAHVLDVRPVAVIERALEQLHAEDAEDNEERAANEDNVADRPQRREKRLDDELQPGRTVDHAQWPQRAEQPEDLCQTGF